jgi:hypothetical protein
MRQRNRIARLLVVLAVLAAVAAGNGAGWYDRAPGHDDKPSPRAGWYD